MKTCPHCSTPFAPKVPWQGFCCAKCRKATRAGFKARLKREALARASYTCEECADSAKDVHHITPLFEGGTNDLANLQALCKVCHKAKHDWSAYRAPQTIPIDPAA